MIYSQIISKLTKYLANSILFWKTPHKHTKQQILVRLIFTRMSQDFQCIDQDAFYS